MEHPAPGILGIFKYPSHETGHLILGRQRSLPSSRPARDFKARAGLAPRSRLHTWYLRQVRHIVEPAADQIERIDYDTKQHHDGANYQQCRQTKATAARRLAAETAILRRLERATGFAPAIFDVLTFLVLFTVTHG
jgi:hypothetical protein